jgi:3'(2'), 5'-bisphosphate nucleotidase
MQGNIPELAVAAEAARQAAHVCVEVYNSLVDEASKAGREPVTIADYASQVIINSQIRAAFPDDGILGEEHAAEFATVLTDTQRGQVAGFVEKALGRSLSMDEIKAALDPPAGSSGRLWIIDPIDGTKGFLAKRAYAIAIALLDGDDLKVGVLACPNLSVENPGELTDDGALFYAVRGAGAFHEPLTGGDAIPMHVSTATPADPLVIVTSFEKEHSDKGLFASVVDDLPSRQKDTLALDGQGKYGLVAAGRVSCFFRLVPAENYREKAWDHAAGTIIVQEAGGRVTDFHGKALDFVSGPKMTHNRGIVVTNGTIHAAMLAAIQKTNWEES